ncbi:D-glycero-alpha-D-manno-heptose-1,7-bisphosphate 7-phosphatase [Ferrovibrio sp.]|uniref:D-glycero-alpha-D-manno-heptose-1,7-bisphosphate 7-phosphatase n=1 Tax=Ferrovibrio sp. TaxID=1917215 RepID=UPI0035B27FFE
MSNSILRRAIFLDRDGVLNRSLVRNGRPYAPLKLEEFELYPGTAEALARLKRAGFLLIVATNQPEVARGALTRSTLDAMHAHMTQALPLDDVMICAQEEGPDCDCYKPKPGMLLMAAAKHSIDLASSYMVGDRWRDVGAGQAAGCHTVFIEHGYSERQPNKPDMVAYSLDEAVSFILRHVSDTASIARQ